MFGRSARPRAGQVGAAEAGPLRRLLAGCSRCAGAGLCWRQASNGGAGPGLRAAPSFPPSFPAAFPARPHPLREAMLRPPPRPRRRRQVTAPRVPRPCPAPGVALPPPSPHSPPGLCGHRVWARRLRARPRGGCTGRAPSVVIAREELPLTEGSADRSNHPF